MAGMSQIYEKLLSVGKAKKTCNGLQSAFKRSRNGGIRKICAFCFTDPSQRNAELRDNLRS